MLYSPLINKAIDIAYSAHHGQKDKSGRPYFLHPVVVASQMDTESEVCAALLHDVVEDTDVTLSELEAIFPEEITQAVKVLTHKSGVEYLDYIREIKRNPIARKVKLADLKHNTDITRLDSPEQPEQIEAFNKRRQKYELAKQILQE
ncbi:MAG: HD domain-containing protein [Synergistaceae bacterium]|nr:HD domain-containing protein [Synergistaceae bacterium]